MGLLLRTFAHVATLIFFAILVVMFAIRYVPQRTAPGFYARCAAVAGTFLSVGIVLLPPQELSSALYLISLILIITGTVFAICAGLVLGRSISILPEARRLRNLGALCPRTTPTLSWRDRRPCWSCPAVPVSMGATVAGAAIRIPIAAYEKRGTAAISGLSGIRRLHGADALVWCRACTRRRSYAATFGMPAVITLKEISAAPARTPRRCSRSHASG